MADIPITRPLFGEEELEAVRGPLESGWVVQGPRVAEFEELFARFTGVPHAAAASSCTTALHLAVAALGLGRGDEVVVPAFTWVATANVVEYQGATPVFADVELETFNLDPSAAAERVSAKTVGLLPVHLFGLCAEMAPLAELAARHGLWTVEDAACAFGSTYRGRHAGTLGDAGCFSFHPRKSITTGEGGMVTTARDDLDRLVRTLRDHGASRTDLERHEGRHGFLLADYDHLGYNYRMTDLQGALGVAQMGRARSILERRRELASGYDELLAPLPWLRPPARPVGHEHAFQAYVCLFAPEEPELAASERLGAWRNRVMARLERRGVATRPGTHAPVTSGYYARRYGLAPEAYPNAAVAERLSLALPLYPQMTATDQERVVRELGAAFEAERPC